MPNPVSDGGYSGRLKSLANVEGSPNRGVRVDFRWVATTGTTSGTVALTPNTRRKWAILHNSPYYNSAALYIHFNDPMDGTATGISLDVGDSFVIDDNFPYTGAVYVGTPTGIGNLLVYEASIE
jgi:hypothetical protein